MALVMRGLTLTPPWTGPVAAGIKRIENRPRPVIKREDFGKPFTLHAGRAIDESVYDLIHLAAPELYDGWHPSEPSSWPAWYRLSRITSAAIAVCYVERAVVLQENGVDVRDFHTRELVDLGEQRRWLANDQIGYVVAGAQVLAEPVPMRGWQGFWSLTLTQERAVAAQIVKVA